MIDGEKLSQVIELGKRIKDRLGRSKTEDEFSAVRLEAGQLTQELASNPTNSITVQKIIECLRKFEALNHKKLSNTSSNRSIVNQSILSSRIKSTHYSAFIAGKYGENVNIGPKFKCWLYNSAAHGAIETAVLIDGLLASAKKGADEDLVATAKLFRSSAISDASRFLEWSRMHDPDQQSVLRLFNSARIDIISNDLDRITFGIKRLRDMPPLDNDGEAADICWHENNLETFNSDKRLQEIIRRHAANSLELIHDRLAESARTAQTLRDHRGDIWKNEHGPNKAAIASFGAIMVTICSYAYDHPSAASDAFEFSKDLLEYLEGIFNTAIDGEKSIILTAAGDGGLAGPNRFARVIYGDGGLA